MAQPTTQPLVQHSDPGYPLILLFCKIASFYEALNQEVVVSEGSCQCEVSEGSCQCEVSEGSCQCEVSEGSCQCEVSENSIRPVHVSIWGLLFCIQQQVAIWSIY